MDTLEFFRTILPEDGPYYFLALFTEMPGAPRHRAYTDLAVMAEASDAMASGSLHIYHACASYLQPEYDEVRPNGSTKKRWRERPNVGRVKCFWLDIDCGQAKFDSGDGYLTKTDAARALLGFCDRATLPRPMIIDSGNGLHAYWPLTRDISVDNWELVAQLLKAVLVHAGVRQDTSRTSDPTSILRPPGTFNRKGAEKPVLVRRESGPCEPEEFARLLKQYAKAHDIGKSVGKGKPAPATTLNSDLTGHLANRPHIDSTGEMVATHCQQIARMRDTQGDVSYKAWVSTIGVLRHCTDGRELAEQWTEKREATGHASVDWDVKFDTLDHGPTKCTTFAEDGGCDGCQWLGKITSPIVLGRVIPINEAQEIEVVDDTGGAQVVVAPAIAHGYTWNNGLLARILPDKDGIAQAHPFSTTHFYPTTRIRIEDGTFRIGMRMHLPNKKIRDFEMAADAMASQTDMLRALAKYELMQSNHKDAGSHMAAYLRDQLEALKLQVEAVDTHTCFGWKDGSFLLGDRLYNPDGTVQKVLVGGNAAAKVAAFPAPKGRLSQYALAINTLYNHAGAQHWQYALCSGWGSILSPFGEELYCGLMLALRGGDSGKGKTTVCFASLYAFGDAKEMTTNGKSGFTTNALYAKLGTYNNIPLLIDELTNIDGPVLSDTAYSVSNGKEKERLTSKGGVVTFASNHTWALSPFVTGNRDFHGLLASNQGNSQAEAVRLIQIDVDRYKPVCLDPDPGRESEIVQQAIEVMKNCRGVAGDALVKYVVANTAAISAQVRELLNELNDVVPNPKFRLYRSHAACTLAAARITKELGIHDFDLDELRAWTEDMLRGLEASVAATNTITLDEAFSRMMADLMQQIIVTSEFRDARSTSGPETPRNRIHGVVAGRYVLGTTRHTEHAGHIMINQRAVRDWCSNNRTDYDALLRHLEDASALISRQEKVTLTKGTDLPGVQARCIVVDGYKLDKDAATTIHNIIGESENVVAIR